MGRSFLESIEQDTGNFLIRNQVFLLQAGNSSCLLEVLHHQFSSVSSAVDVSFLESIEQDMDLYFLRNQASGSIRQ